MPRIPGLSPGAGQWYGLIRGATLERLSTSDIWSSLRSVGAQIAVTDVSRLRGWATREREAMANLARLPDRSPLDASVTSRALWGRDTRQWVLAPRWQVMGKISGFQTFITEEGRIARVGYEQWVSLKYNRLPTKGAIKLDLITAGRQSGTLPIDLSDAEVSDLSVLED